MGEYYPKGVGKEFYSEECREAYRKKLVSE